MSTHLYAYHSCGGQDYTTPLSPHTSRVWHPMV